MSLVRSAGASLPIGVIRPLSGGGCSWTVALSGAVSPPAFVDDGVAALPEIASTRLWGALEEHDPARFGRSQQAISAIRNAFVLLGAVAIQSGRTAIDLDDTIELVASTDPRDSVTANSMKTELWMVLPERATLDGFLDCHGAPGLVDLSEQVIDRMDRIYPLAASS
ncbi:hypothetical protein [Sphingosinicella sp. BN140058]|uniref:hypothetical protein n=1 Tax=Sphingosinicella sp. BN140058 TaxID=1892855 RepID=UPI0010103F3E|nr:hypothetical protein [Sphingosinicella sp. BN140058]QAY80246.1 hypothetical protein ETR14_26750 [Sphingosinicella sp. BN140058]